MRIKSLLTRYLELRIAFYQIHDPQRLTQINAATGEVQTDLWSAVQAEARDEPTPIVALIVSGMNDVFNARGNTQAAWETHIPAEAWVLMEAIAFLGCVLIGLGTYKAKTLISWSLPLVIAVAFFLVHDLDTPRRGLIRTYPRNLVDLSKSLRSH